LVAIILTAFSTKNCRLKLLLSCSTSLCPATESKRLLGAGG